MRLIGTSLTLCLLSTFTPSLNAQQSAPSTGGNAPAAVRDAVPALVSYGGVLQDARGRAMTSLTGVTFLVYRDQTGGAPLWMETQNVTPDKLGRYTVQLGSVSGKGMPADLFVSGEARWLAVQIAGEQEQARTLLLAVPYAMKARDAETIGGLPPSAFVLAVPGAGAVPAIAPAAIPAAGDAAAPPAASNVTTTGGTVNAIPLFTSASNIQNSILTQSGTTTVNVVGKLNLPAMGAATATAGRNSRPEAMVASVFNSGTAAPVPQIFQLQAEPANNNTTTPSGTLNLLYASGATVPAETGLKINNKGQITFAAGQTFPGTGSGTVKSVGLAAPAADFTVTGSPVTNTGTLNLAWKVAPTNANTANAIVKRDASGNFNAGTITASVLNATDASFSDGLSITSPAQNPLFVTTPNSVGTTAIYGSASATTGIAFGVEGVTASDSGSAYAVVGNAIASDGNATGVYGVTSSPQGAGTRGQLGTQSLLGEPFAANGGIGVWGDAGGGGTIPVIAVLGTVDDGVAGAFYNDSFNGRDTVLIKATNAGSNPLAAYGANGSCVFDSSGNLFCTGTINGSAKHFRIDHPLDPANKYLVHSSVESSEMKNIYDGVVTTGAEGEARVQLPDWFEAENGNFRYQLTVIGQFAQAIVSREIQNHEFAIKTSLPNVKVSWQVTGVRKDAWALSHPVAVEEAKDAKTRGLYIHPELFGAGKEKGIDWTHQTEIMKRKTGGQAAAVNRASLPGPVSRSGPSTAETSGR